MKSKHPHIIILAGPNGAGKSTTAPMLLRDTFAVDEFVNADAIAQGLSAFAPESAALEAGKIMLRRLRELAQKRSNFAFETTLASRSLAPWLAKLRAMGYQVHLLFLALPDAQSELECVAMRVKLGGHNIPGDVFSDGSGQGCKIYSNCICLSVRVFALDCFGKGNSCLFTRIVDVRNILKFSEL